LTGYREGINSLRKVANKLVEQAELLNQAVDELQNEADLMQALEEQLDEIASSQGSSTNEIIMMVRENEEILSKQKANLRVSSFKNPHLHWVVEYVT
jgi:cupin superfamily acireductone dioxygenase involved in methionine salvage